MSRSLWPRGLQPARLLCPQDSPGKNTGVGYHALPWGDRPGPGIDLEFLSAPTLAGGFFTTSATWEAHKMPWWDRSELVYAHPATGPVKDTESKRPSCVLPDCWRNLLTFCQIFRLWQTQDPDSWKLFILECCFKQNNRKKKSKLNWQFCHSFLHKQYLQHFHSLL